MQGIIILLILFIILFLVSRVTDLKPTINFKDKFEYVPIITSNIYADLLIILITFSGILGVGYDLPFGLRVDGRYNFGFTDVLKDISGKNSVVTLAVGFSFL